MTKEINPNLTEQQKLVLFKEQTEPPGTSELNHEKREGSFHCANCGEKLFDSKSKLLIWQGKGYGGINEYMKNRDERINLFVSQILKNYPPVEES